MLKDDCTNIALNTILWVYDVSLAALLCPKPPGLGTTLALHFGARRIKAARLLIVTCSNQPSHLSTQQITHPPHCRLRRLIECMLSDAKTKDPNLWGCKMMLSNRLNTLNGISTIVLAMARHTESKLMRGKYPAWKKLGYCSKSWLRTGFGKLRRHLKLKTTNKSSTKKSS